MVLSRHKDEKIVATLPDGRRLTLMVIEIRGDKVRLGWDAPRDIVIHREEVQNRIEATAGEGRTE